MITLFRLKIKYFKQINELINLLHYWKDLTKYINFLINYYDCSEILDWILEKLHLKEVFQKQYDLNEVSYRNIFILSHPLTPPLIRIVNHQIN